MQNVQKKLWSSWMALSWLDVQWRSAMWLSARTRPRPARSWITMNWRGPASTWEPPVACSWWLDWQKVCSGLFIRCKSGAFHWKFVNGNISSLQELAWKFLLLPSRLSRWLDPCPSQPSVVHRVRINLQLFSCPFQTRPTTFNRFSFFLQLFQLHLRARLWTCRLSRWPHTAFSSPTFSTHKRKTNLISVARSSDYKPSRFNIPPISFLERTIPAGPSRSRMMSSKSATNMEVSFTFTWTRTRLK